MTKKFKQGDTVYSDYGQQAEYVANVGGGHIVRPLVEAYSGDGEHSYEHLCEPVTWQHVFDKPPTAKYSQELTELHKQIETARNALHSIQNEHRTFMNSARERAAERSKIEDLKHLDDVIAGRITHFAIIPHYSHYPMKVMTFKEGIERRGDYGRTEIRLLSLYGKPEYQHDGRYQWSLHQYPGENRDSEIVYPCTSEEEAKEFIQKYIAGKLAEQEKSPDGHALQWVTHAATWGVVITPKAAEKAEQIKAEADNRAKDSAQKAYAQAVERMQKLGMEVPA